MRRRARSPDAGVVFAVLSAGAVAGLVAAGVVWGRLAWVYAWLLAVNVWTFACYGYDKAAAGRGLLRVPEAILHGLALIGATPAAWLGRRVFRHKTLKRSFRRVFWAIAILQAAAVVLWACYR